jgi:hypothetical protein
MQFGLWVHMNQLFENTFIKYLKFRKEYSHVHPDILCSRIGFLGKEYFCVPHRKDFFLMLQYNYSRDIFCLFTQATSKVPFSENLEENIECPDTYGNFSFNYFKFYFYTFLIINLYVSENQNITFKRDKYFEGHGYIKDQLQGQAHSYAYRAGFTRP